MRNPKIDPDKWQLYNSFASGDYVVLDSEGNEHRMQGFGYEKPVLARAPISIFGNLDPHDFIGTLKNAFMYPYEDLVLPVDTRFRLTATFNDSQTRSLAEVAPLQWYEVRLGHCQIQQRALKAYEPVYFTYRRLRERRYEGE